MVVRKRTYTGNFIVTLEVRLTHRTDFDMKKITPLLLIFALLLGFPGIEPVKAGTAKTEVFGKKKKFKGYKKPRSKKILGIFKRKTDCGCPSH